MAPEQDSAGAVEGEVVTYPGQPVEPPATALTLQLGPGELPERTRQAFEPEVVLIPAGPFLMGTPESELEALAQLPSGNSTRTKINMPMILPKTIIPAH